MAFRPPAIAAELNNLGASLYELGDDVGALEMYQGAVEATVRSMHSDDADDETSEGEDGSERRTALEEQVAKAREKLAAACPSTSSTTDRQTDDSFVRNRQRKVLLSRSQTHVLTEAFAIQGQSPPSPMAHQCNDRAYKDKDCVNDSSVESAIILYNMAMVQNRVGDAKSSKALLQMVLNVAPDGDEEGRSSGIIVPDDDGCAMQGFLIRPAALNNLGHFQYNAGKWDESLTCLEEALRLGWKAVRRVERGEIVSSPGAETTVRRYVAIILNNLAVVMNRIGQEHQGNGMYEDAMRLFVSALKTRGQFLRLDGEELVGSGSPPIYPCILRTIGNIQFWMGNHEEAMGAFEASAKLWGESIMSDGEDDSQEDFSDLMLKMGLVQLEVGTVSEARRSFEASLEVARSAFGGDHRSVARPLYELGRIYQMMGRYGDALDAYTNVLRIEVMTLGEHDPEVLKTFESIAHVHHLRGRIDLAVEAYVELVDMIRRFMGPTHHSIVAALHTVGGLYLEQGNIQKATLSFTEATQIAADQADCEGDDGLANVSSHAILGIMQSYPQGASAA